MAFSLKNIFLLILLMLSFSCGQSRQDDIDESIETANMLISQGRYTDAINLLRGLTYQHTNALYIQTLASGYAGRAGFTEPGFIGNDIAKIGSTSANILGSFATFTTSTMTSATDSTYVDMQSAIDTILYAGNIAKTSEPTHAARTAIFASTDAGNLSFQALFMVMAQLGKYFKYYGNTDSAGLKGAGAAGNNCVYGQYATEGLPGNDKAPNGVTTAPCDDLMDGHADLRPATVGNAVAASRMCQGVILFNNFLNLVDSGILSTLGNVGSIGNLDAFDGLFTTVFNTACGALGAQISGTNMCTVKSQTTCETDHGGATGPSAELVRYFGWIFETLLTN